MARTGGGGLSLAKMLSRVNSFEISQIKEQETTATIKPGRM